MIPKSTPMPIVLGEKEYFSGIGKIPFEGPGTMKIA